MFALWLGHVRVDTRRAFTMMDGVRSANQDATPLHMFRAIYDTEEEALAKHELHVDRVRHALSARDPRNQMMLDGEGG